MHFERSLYLSPFLFKWFRHRDERLAVHLTQRRGRRTKPQQKVSKFKGKGRKEISQVRRQCHCCQNAENQWHKSRKEKNEICYRKRHTTNKEQGNFTAAPSDMSRQQNCIKNMMFYIKSAAQCFWKVIYKITEMVLPCRHTVDVINKHCKPL